MGFFSWYELAAQMNQKLEAYGSVNQVVLPTIVSLNRFLIRVLCCACCCMLIRVIDVDYLGL